MPCRMLKAGLDARQRAACGALKRIFKKNGLTPQSVRPLVYFKQGVQNSTMLRPFPRGGTQHRR
jgi:hypothetical protein